MARACRSATRCGRGARRGFLARARGDQRQLDHEAAAEGERALGADAAAVQLDDLLGEGEAETGAARLAGDEEVEEMRQLVGRNARPGVGDGEVELSAAVAAPSPARGAASR